MSTFGLQLQIFLRRCHALSYRAGRKIFRLLLPANRLLRLKRICDDLFQPGNNIRVRLLYGALAKLRPEAYFIQIGANDGIIVDPLRECVLAQSWRGIFIEPVPYLFERLQANYPRRTGLEFENIAIADKAGIKPFYYVRPSEEEKGLPAWHIGLGSFLRDVIEAHAHIIPDIKERIVTHDVPCMTFSELCEKHQVRSLDVLNIDTEGYDFEIIKTIDFEQIRPLILVYEQHLLSPADRQACQELLTAAGYQIMANGQDAACLNTRDLQAQDAPLLHAWEILRASPI